MRAIVIFARSPQREALAKGLRIETAAPLFRSFAAMWLREAERAGATAVVACDDGDLAGIAPEIDRVHIRQRGVRFGDRAANAVADAFALGFDAVLLAAIDAPPVSVDAAFAALERGVAVIAPSRDGGVNFIGLTAPEPELLARFEVQQRNLIDVVRSYFDEMLVLEASVDVDSSADLEAARPYLVRRDAPRCGADRFIPSRAPPA